MRRAVYVNCDGLCPDWIRADLTPVLARLLREGRSASDHRGVFPTVTRASAASVATGCMPARHGLHGNRMALEQDGRLVVHDVGPVGFPETLRRVTGRSLKVPSLAERLEGQGDFVAYSNVSAGAAQFLAPEGHGCVRHRDFGTCRGEKVAPLAVSHDMAGDEAMTGLFLRDVLTGSAAAAVLWLANPDLTLHGAALGSPAHLEALARTDACVARVERAVAARRDEGEDILLMVGSDHGQESVAAGVDLHGWARQSGLGGALAAGRIAFATQGTAVLVYALDDAGPLLAALRAAPWGGELVSGDALADLAGHGGALVAAVNMARREGGNAFGVPGLRLAAFEGPDFQGIGCGQHGGWGRDENRPFLTLLHPELPGGSIAGPTGLVDIAPTFLEFLGLPAGGMDGRSLLSPARLTESNAHSIA